MFRRVVQTRVAVEAATGAQAEEDLARAPLQSLLHLDGVLARIEDEQGNDPSFPEPVQHKAFTWAHASWDNALRGVSSGDRSGGRGGSECGALAAPKRLL